MLDQPLGVGLREARSLDMTVVSLADVNVERVRKEKMKVERPSKFLRPPINFERDGIPLIFLKERKRERSCAMRMCVGREGGRVLGWFVECSDDG